MWRPPVTMSAVLSTSRFKACCKRKPPHHPPQQNHFTLPLCACTCVNPVLLCTRHHHPTPFFWPSKLLLTPQPSKPHSRCLSQGSLTDSPVRFTNFYPRTKPPWVPDTEAGLFSTALDVFSMAHTRTDGAKHLWQSCQQVRRLTQPFHLLPPPRTLPLSSRI